MITDLIADGVAARVYHSDDVRLTALFLLGQVNWVYQWYVPGASPAPELIARQVLDNFLHGLVARQAPAVARAA